MKSPCLQQPSRGARIACDAILLGKNIPMTPKPIVSAMYKSGRLAALLSLMLLGSCSTLPLDAKLKGIFYGNRDDFNRLVQMSEQDPQLMRIDFDFTDSGPRKNVGLSEDRWQQYRVLFRKLGLTDGLGRSTETPPTIFFTSNAEGRQSTAIARVLLTRKNHLYQSRTALTRCPRMELFSRRCHQTGISFVG
jgi:hypothetical protein